MEANKFYRSFLIFSQEDMGYGINGTPSGYVKIEARDGKGKLNASVQNLKENKDGSSYKIYILKCSDNFVYPVCAGVIPCQKNRGELLWEFNPRDVANTGIPIHDFNVAAVIVENNKVNSNIICPLAAYKDKKVQWKDKMKLLQSNAPTKNEEDEGDVIKKHEAYSKYENVLSSKYTKPESIQNAEPVQIQKDNVSEKIVKAEETKTEIIANTPETLPVEMIEENIFEDYKEIKLQTDTSNAASNVTNLAQTISVPADIGNSAVPNEIPLESNKMEQDLKVPGFSNGHVNIEGLKVENPAQGQMAQNPGVCSYMNSPYCNPQMNGNMPFGCANCTMKTVKKEEPQKEKAQIDRTAVANMEKFQKSLDAYFEVNDPFKSNRRDYKWWKVNSPVQLNNVFYQCNIRTPLFFNPSVMMAHYKYRYLIVGIYSDKMRRREYIVCGIPGVYGIDDRPFGDMCRWVQVEGSKPRYGAYGYWLVYIDPKTGKFLELN